MGRDECMWLLADIEVVIYSRDVLWDALALHRRRYQVCDRAQEETVESSILHVLRQWCISVISDEVIEGDLGLSQAQEETMVRWFSRYWGGDVFQKPHVKCSYTA
jgi:hypothetical protein